MRFDLFKNKIDSITSSRIFRVLAVLAVSLLVIWALLWFVLRPSMIGSARDALNRKLQSVTAELGGTVRVGGVEPTLDNEVVLTDVEIGDEQGVIVAIPSIRLGFSVMDVLSGSRMPEYVAIEDMLVHLDYDSTTIKRLTDIKDMLKAFAMKRPGSAQNAGSSGGSLPDIIIDNAMVSLIDSETREPIVSLTDINLTADGSHMVWEWAEHAGSWWDVEGSLNVLGLQTASGETQTLLDIEGEIVPKAGFKLKVSSETPFLAPRNKNLPAVVSLGSLDVEMDRSKGRLVASLGNLRLNDLGQLAERFTHGRFQVDGELEMASAILELDVGDRPTISDLSVERLVSLSVSGAKFSAMFSEGRLVRLKDMSVKMTPLSPDTAAAVAPVAIRKESKKSAPAVEMIPSWNVEVKALAGTGNLTDSPVSLTGRLSRELDFIDGHLKTEGALPVGVISMLHNRVLPWGNPSLMLDVDVHHDGEFWKVAGHASGRDLTYFWTKICLVPLTGLYFDTDFDLLVSRPEKVMIANLSSFRIGDFELTASVEYEHSRAQPVVKATVNIPRQSCQSVFDAIPPVMMPRLIGTRLGGEMSYGVKLNLDSTRNTSFELFPDMEGCQVKTFGSQVDLDLLMSPYFVHYAVETDKEPEVIATGPGSDSFTPLEEIPVPVQQAALATEDMNFFLHKGFAPGLIKRAIVLNMDKGWYVYGGSTISQQLVKNLFLSREKTIGRKLEEAIIVWEMERRIPKEKTLELYLNCIEFGYHMYGIKAAALEYFNKTPAQLTPLEASFIMATKPSPKSAYQVYKRKTFGKWWIERLEGIMKRLWAEMDVITEEEYAGASPWIPTFWYGDEGIYEKPEIVGTPDVPTGFGPAVPAADQVVPGGQQDGVAGQAAAVDGQPAGIMVAPVPVENNHEGAVNVQPEARQEVVPVPVQDNQIRNVPSQNQQGLLE
jgi:hypothetical protein